MAEREKRPGWPKGQRRTEANRKAISEARQAWVARDRRIKELAAELAALLAEEKPRPTRRDPSLTEKVTP